MRRVGLIALLAALLSWTALVPLRPVALVLGAAAAERDLGSATPESVGVSAERLQRLDAAMKRFVDDARLAGVVTMLARRGKIVDVNTFGRKDATRADAMARDSIFRIYSMSKPITGIAMMLLYEEGKWRLDDPISRHIPEFGKLKVFTGDDGAGGMKTEDAARPMTMRELMTHSGGLAYGLGTANPVDRQYREMKVLDSSLPLQNMIDAMAKIPLLSQPGTRYSYSAAVDVQGYLVEKLSGQSFADFLQQRVFAPLGMKDTAFYVPKEKMGRLARIHTEDPAGGPLRLTDNRGALAGSGVSPDETVPPKGASGGAGLYSTIDDYMRFCQMLLDGGQLNGVRLLAPRTAEMIRSNHLRPEPLATMRAGTGWGMDFAVVMDPAAAGEPYSKGVFYWAGAAGTWFWIDPALDFAFVGMIQHSGRAIQEVQGVSRNLVYQAIMN
jgi:CubicO group peptidase (beta-lactamase class C family)